MAANIEEVFPRPYKTWLNLENASKSLKSGKLSTIASMPVAPPASLSNPSYLPNSSGLDFYTLDWKLPISAPLQTSKAAELCASKSHLPNYNIKDVLQTFDQLQNELHEMVQKAHNANAFDQAALVAQLTRSIFMDVLGAVTSPLRVKELQQVLCKILPQVQKDLKTLKYPRHHGTKSEGATIDENYIAQHRGLSAHLLFVLLDEHFNHPLLLNYFTPILQYAIGTLAHHFKCHQLCSPSNQKLQTLVFNWLAWFLRLKREYPTVGFYFALAHLPPDQQFVQVHGGPCADAVIAFNTMFGIWDCYSGSVGVPAQVWVKSLILQQ